MCSALQNVAALGIPLLASLYLSSPALCEESRERERERHRKAFVHKPHPRGAPVKVFSDWLESFKEEV